MRIVRDSWGVPHIYAQNDADLFFAQGFVQAQDRLFQMDLWRRSAQGRLSEVLGPNFIERDAMTRRIQYRGDMDAEWKSYGAGAKAIAEAFVGGVNAWVTLARERPPEEFVLAGWKPELWSADDLLDRTEAFVESGDALDEVFRARLIATVGLARARLLLAEDRPLNPAAGVDPAVVPALVAEMLRRVGTPPFFLGLAAPVTAGTVRTSPGKQPDGDPTRTLANPSPRYFVHLNAPGWNVIGATAPWRPGVAEGHNEHLGWTTAPLAVDSQDVYVEKLNPANPQQVEDGGRWVDIDSRKGFIAVRGRKVPVDFTTETTRHGVIVASDLERHLAFAVRWSGSEPGAAAELAAPAVDRAAGSAEFRDARTQWKMPARALSLVEGGATVPSALFFIPERRGWSGTLPVAGWTGENEWKDGSIAGPAPTATSTKGKATQVLLEALRVHPDRADALLQTLASAASRPDSLIAQRAALVDALAEALRDRSLPVSGNVLFAHPLAVTDPARRRFNVLTSSPSGPAAADLLSMTFDAHDWDRSTAINAPGQSGSPESPHFADLAALWSQGKTFTLAFTERAVGAHAKETLTLTPR